MRNKIIIGTLALISTLAIALGFAAAFGKTVGGDTVNSIYKDIHDMPSAMLDKMPAFLTGHVNFAFIGGIITGVLGILGLGVAGFLGFKEKSGSLEINTPILVVIIVSTIAMFAMAIVAIVYQGQLNSETWMMEHSMTWAQAHTKDAADLMGALKALGLA